MAFSLINLVTHYFSPYASYSRSLYFLHGINEVSLPLRDNVLIS